MKDTKAAYLTYLANHLKSIGGDFRCNSVDAGKEGDVRSFLSFIVNTS